MAPSDLDNHRIGLYPRIQTGPLRVSTTGRVQRPADAEQPFAMSATSAQSSSTLLMAAAIGDADSQP
jgi:hypothetical protein